MKDKLLYERFGPNMKILFIHPASGTMELTENRFLSTGAYLPPLGILYLAKMLELNGHQVEVVDCNAKDVNTSIIKRAIKRCDVVGMTTYCQPVELNNSIMLSKLVKQIDDNIPLIVGGPHCSLLPDLSIQEHNADVCLKGPGEFIITPLVEALEKGENLSAIPGICYKKGKTIQHTKPANTIHDLDEIPFPARHLVNGNNYGFMLGKKMARGKVTSILTGRGCTNRCRFCNLHAHIPLYHGRSIANITKEIEEIIQDGYSTLVFVDDNFMVDKKKVEQIMDFIRQKNTDVKLWIFGSRADSPDRSLYEKMRDAGVELINFGSESGNQDVLDYYNKKLTLAQIRESVNLAKEMGFFVSSTFIIGAPIETEQHILNTIEFAKSLPINVAIFYLFTYTYKSGIWQEAVDRGKIRPDEYRVHPDINRGLGNFTTEELMKFTLKANYSFYLNPRRWLREITWSIANKKIWYLNLGFRILTG